MGSCPRCSLGKFALPALMLCAAMAHAQVFVVGEKTAEADVNTDFHPTHVQLPAEPLSQAGYMDLVRNLEAEQGFAHRELPLGAGLTLIANGNMTPDGEQYKQILYKKGESAAAGERVAVTSLKVYRDRIIIDVNGGPYARHRFLSHISLNDMPLAQQGPLATGSRITLVFEGGVPDVTAAEVKALLDPLIDFRARSASEAYANTLPPLAKEAVATHQILVGMDQRMVLASVGAPREKQREHLKPDDPNSPVQEEWIYGEPPVPIQFVRFKNGRVVRLEIAAIGKPIEVHDKNEMGADQTGPVLQARTILNGDEPRSAGEDLGRRRPPTLARPGEVLDSSAATMGRVLVPGSSNCSPSADSSKTASTASSPTPASASAPPAASPSAGSTPAGTPAPNSSEPCPEPAKTTTARNRDAGLSPSIGSTGTIGTGLPDDSSSSGLPGSPSGLPSSAPGSNYPGGSYPGGSGPAGSGPCGGGYPPLSGPQLPGSTIPIGPSHNTAGNQVARSLSPDVVN